MLLPKQIWKDIEGYEGLYQVSNTGKVRSLNYKGTGKKKIWKYAITVNTYKQIALCKNGEIKYYYIHRLVAQAFIPNPNNYPVVNHKDENKSNNVVWNLEWCTQEYNCNYGTCQRRKSETRKSRSPKLTTQEYENRKKQYFENRKISESMKGEPAWNKGLHHTEEPKRKISKAKKGKSKGKHHTGETKRKVNETVEHRNLILHEDLEQQTQLKKQLDKVHQIYNDCHDK